MKNCNCLEKIDAQLRILTKDDKAQLNCVTFFDGSPSKPYMEYTYREKKKDGSFKNFKKSGTMVPTHCPFCGKAYDEEK